MQDGLKLFRAVDPNHMYSFRASMSGSNARWGLSVPSTFYFDFMSLASTLDLMEPEGYNLNDIGGYEQVEFANAYARYAQPDAPVVWKEFAADIWTGSHFERDEVRAQRSGEHYEKVYQHCLNTNTAGVFAWWSASGNRVDESGNSAIWYPDGSDHPVTEVMRKYAPLFINQGEIPEPEVLIAVDRDDVNGGVFGIYAAVIDTIRECIEQGKSFAIVDNSMDKGEMVYADTVYKEPVGGTSKSGTYPLRYVNGMVKDVEVVEKDGKTVALITVCNTKQTVWRAGTVSIVSYKTSDVKVDAIIDQDVAYLENVTVEVPLEGKGDLDLRFKIEKVEFGPLYSTVIE
jgi:hypothetical protein